MSILYLFGFFFVGFGIYCFGILLFWILGGWVLMILGYYCLECFGLSFNFFLVFYVMRYLLFYIFKKKVYKLILFVNVLYIFFIDDLIEGLLYYIYYGIFSLCWKNIIFFYVFFLIS